MYVIKSQVYACTRTKVAKHQTPATNRQIKLVETQGPPINLIYRKKGIFGRLLVPKLQIVHVNVT